MLYYRDELAGSIKVRNQYRGGYGADEEAELDQWNGSAVIVDRAEKSICLPTSAISRTGSIQWEVLANLMGDHQDTNGAWSRWLFCAADAPPRYLNLLGDEPDSKITETLTWLYTELAKVPKQDYGLSLEAKQLFETWQHQLVDAQRAEEALGLQLVYPKIEAYTARLALWLHIVNAVLRQEQPTPVISGQTMERAIELAAYYLWQHKLIHTHNSPDSGLAAIALKIHKYVERVGEATASKLKSGVRALRTMGAAQIRQLMQTLAKVGYGSVRGEGTDMVYATSSPIALPLIDTLDAIDSLITTPSIAKTHIQQIISATDDEIDELTLSVNQSDLPDPDQPRIPDLETAVQTPSVSLKRGTQIEVWFEKAWVIATYLYPLYQSIFSRRIQQLDDGHQVALAVDPEHMRAAEQMPTTYPVAGADIRLPQPAH